MLQGIRQREWIPISVPWGFVGSGAGLISGRIHQYVSLIHIRTGRHFANMFPGTRQTCLRVFGATGQHVCAVTKSAVIRWNSISPHLDFGCSSIRINNRLVFGSHHHRFCSRIHSVYNSHFWLVIDSDQQLTLFLKFNQLNYQAKLILFLRFIISVVVFNSSLKILSAELEAFNSVLDLNQLSKFYNFCS